MILVMILINMGYEIIPIYLGSISSPTNPLLGGSSQLEPFRPFGRGPTTLLKGDDYDHHGYQPLAANGMILQVPVTNGIIPPTSRVITLVTHRRSKEGTPTNPLPTQGALFLHCSFNSQDAVAQLPGA